MKNKKKVLQVISEAVKESFINGSPRSLGEAGKISEAKVKKITELFKKLPVSQSITYLTQYAKALKREEEKSILYIQSSIPLSPANKKQIVHQFEKSHKISTVEVKLNSSLKAGVLIKIGDMVYEDSLESRIRQLGMAIAG